MTHSKNPADIAREVLLLDTFEDYDINVYVDILKAADDLYFNGKESFIEDNEYDAIRAYAYRLAPHHSYFTGVGSEVRGGKVKLPYPMGSLDQVDIGQIQGWVKECQLRDDELVVTDKLDGASALIIYDDDGNLQIAYSRGDGTMGADITRHIKQFVPQKIKTTKGLAIRGEVILPKDDFPTVREIVKTRGGTPYKNPRNMVSGLMNAERNNPEIYRFLRFVAYDIIGSTSSKFIILSTLQSVGFETPQALIWKSGETLRDDALADYLRLRRQSTKYEIDGLVIDVNSSTKRNKLNPTRDTLNPAYAIKYKVADESNVAFTRVTNVEWNISKHGYLKPRVNVAPVELVGVTVSNATGFNAKFIYDNGIGPGAHVQITRSGDVIPFIQKVMIHVAPQMPPNDLNWDWNETGVDIVLSDMSHEDIMIRQVTDFFATIDVPNLKEGVVRQMFQLNNFGTTIQALQKMLHYNEDHWFSCIGANGRKIYNGIRQKLTNIPLYVLMGACPFFGRGIGVRKFKKLQQTLGADGLLNVESWHQIDDVEGFDEKTARKIINGLDTFKSLLYSVKQIGTIAKDTIATEGLMKDEKVVFTGFRDKNLEKLVEAEGGTMQSAVSGKTTILVAANPNSNSGKMKKARDLGVRIVGTEEFKGILS